MGFINPSAYVNAGGDASAWIIGANTPESPTAWGVIFVLDNHATPAWRRHITFLCRTNLGGSKFAISPDVIPLNTWTLFAAKRQAGTLYIYVDSTWTAGAADADINLATAPNNIDIGKHPQAPPEWFPGSIDELRVYNRGLDLDQVLFWKERSHH